MLQQRLKQCKSCCKTENILVSGKNFYSLLPEGKKKRFVPICHYCNKPGRICPKCVKYKNTLMMNKIEQHYYIPRNASKHKINLKNNSIKKIWVKN